MGAVDIAFAEEARQACSKALLKLATGQQDRAVEILEVFSQRCGKIVANAELAGDQADLREDRFDLAELKVDLRSSLQSGMRIDGGQAMSEGTGGKSPGMGQEQLAALNKEYDTYVDLFKFYVDTTLKVTVWFYTVTGAILAFYFGKDNVKNLHTTVNALLLPTLLSMALSIVFYRGAVKPRKCKQCSRSLAKSYR